MWQDGGNNNLLLSQAIPAPSGTNNTDFGRRVSSESLHGLIMLRRQLRHCLGAQMSALTSCHSSALFAS